MSRYTAVVVTTIVQVCTAFAALAIPSTAPLMIHQFGPGAPGVGTFVSITYAAAAVASVAAGGLVPQLGPIRLCQISLLACATGLAMVGGGTPVWLILGAIGVGIGYGPVTPASSYLLAATTSPKNRRFVFSLKQTGVPAGAALAGAVMPVAMLFMGWRAAVWLVAACYVCIALAMDPARRLLDGQIGLSGHRRFHLLAALTAIFARADLRRLGITAFVLGGAQMCASTFIVSYLHASYGMSLIHAGFLLSVTNVAGVLFRLIWGAAVDRGIGSSKLLAFLAILTGLANFSMADPEMMSRTLSAFGTCVVLGAAAIGWNGVLLAEIPQVVPQAEVGIATSGCLFFSFAGVVALPALFGAVEQANGGYAASWMSIGVMALVLGVALLVANDAASRRRSVDAQ
ncbi:MFS transporter [Burkholderia contaminans]|uniref:MFS transporter n=1 Tax=Burkholderia contaminans TaxID=488447 RepID=UPI003D674DB0